MDDGQSTYGIVPKDFLNSLNQVRNKANILYLKVANPKEKLQIIKSINENFPRYTAQETIEEKNIKKYTKQITQPFTFMVLIVMVVSIFIIYNSFKVIALERIPVIGTFRSIGATRRMINLIFLGESLIYGIIGGVLGCSLGIGVLFVMAKLTTPSWMGDIQTQFAVPPGVFFSAFFLAVILSFGSALIPIRKVASIPIKDVVLNNIEKKSKLKKAGNYYIGLALIIVSLTLPAFVSGSLTVPVSLLAVFFNLIAIIILIPLFIKVSCNFLKRLFKYLFGNEGILALKNLRDNKNIRNNVILLSITVSSILILKVVGFSVMTEVTSYFRDWRFEILASPPRSERNIEMGLRSVPGVEDVYGVLSIRDIE